MMGLCKMSYLFATKCDPKKDYDGCKVIPRGDDTYCVSYESPVKIVGFVDFDNIKDSVVSMRYAVINDTAVENQIAIDVLNTSWFGYSTYIANTGVGNSVTHHSFANKDGSEIFEVFTYPLESETIKNDLKCVESITDSLRQLGAFNKGNEINGTLLKTPAFCVVTKEPGDDGFDCQTTSPVSNVEIRVYITKNDPDTATCYMMFTSPDIPGFRIKFKLTDINSVGHLIIKTKKSIYMRDLGWTPLDVLELRNSTVIISTKDDFDVNNDVKCVGVDMTAEVIEKKVRDRYPGVTITSYVNHSTVSTYRFEKCRIGKLSLGSVLTIKLLTDDKVEKSIKIEYDNYKDIVKTDKGFNIWLNGPGNRFVQIRERSAEDEEEK